MYSSYLMFFQRHLSFRRLEQLSPVCMPRPTCFPTPHARLQAHRLSMRQRQLPGSALLLAATPILTPLRRCWHRSTVFRHHRPIEPLRSTQPEHHPTAGPLSTLPPPGKTSRDPTGDQLHRQPSRSSTLCRCLNEHLNKGEWEREIQSVTECELKMGFCRDFLILTLLYTFSGFFCYLCRKIMIFIFKMIWVRRQWEEIEKSGRSVLTVHPSISKLQTTHCSSLILPYSSILPIEVRGPLLLLRLWTGPSRQPSGPKDDKLAKVHRSVAVLLMLKVLTSEVVAA